MAQKGIAGRRAAIALLGRVLQGHEPLSQAADTSGGPLERLSPPERATALRLTTTVLRHLEPADRALAPFLRKTPPPTIRNALRLGMVEMGVDHAAPHGVVNSIVTILRKTPKTAHLAGLANAVLRRAADSSGSFADLPPQKLPRWLRQPLVHAWGRDAVTAMEMALPAQPPLDLTTKPGLTPRIEGLNPLPTGGFRLVAPGQISTLPGYDEGEWWVQDASAALAMRLLDPKPGETVLDLCAAPGGKTMQAAAAGADVTALDISGPRLARLRANLTRTGLEAEIITADALHWSPPAPFAAILLDAPCSATGTIRRHPDLPFVKDGSDLPALTRLQSQLIDRALSWLAPGGRLVFCTCSLLPEEGETQITAALARHPGLTVSRPALPGLDPGWITKEGGIRLRPDYWADRGGMDGFYMALLTQSATASKEP
ncbi:MAG: RsmB/NOP family class I SAM-dependent RNA methyltransferase [Pseudorhodobacter sp.]